MASGTTTASSLFKTRLAGGKPQDYLPRYKAATFLGDKGQYPLILLPYQPLMVVENGSQNYPWAQEIFLPMDGVGWETLVEINSETAKTLKLRDGQAVWVESSFQKIKARVKLSEGVHPEVVAIPSGQGHSGASPQQCSPDNCQDWGGSSPRISVSAAREAIALAHPNKPCVRSARMARA